MNNTIPKFSEISEISMKFDLGFHVIPWHGSHSLRLNNHLFPWSLTEQEAKILYDSIIKFNLKSGFEIATAFGISSTFMGLALKKTNGKLVTMDAYIEESLNDETETKNYTVNDENVFENADGYKMTQKLLEYFEIKEFVTPKIGWSPKDTGKIIEEVYGFNKLDFAFIDGGHSAEQIQYDTEVIMNFLDGDCILFYHDHFSIAGETLIYLDKHKFKFMENFRSKFNLCMYGRGKFLNL
jgi:predicted O-methyltransferase YrrM